MKNKQRGSRSLRPNPTGSTLIHLFLFVLLACALGAGPTRAGSYLRGTNMAGPQFGNIPGVIDTDYGYNSEASFTYFGNKGLTLTRIGPLWERMQPVLNGPLDTTNVNALNNNISWAKLHGCQVSIELHNYGRYNINEGGVYNSYIIDNVYGGVTKVSTANLCDVWVKISNLYKNEPGVYAYDLMNEPHDMGTANWKTISQAVVTAIRNNGDNKLIYVPGDSWSSAANWVGANGSTPWITDPANNIKYEAHQYFDHDASGVYGWSYDQELASNSNLLTIGADRLAPFANWCATNGVQGYIGEYGAPNTDPRWMTVMDNFLFAADAAGMDATIWAAGERWGGYPLSVEPTNNFTTDAMQMPTLLKHPSSSGVTAGPVAINCGGSSANPFIIDHDFSGGSTGSVANAINTTAVSSPAPQAVYQANRYGACTYTLPGLVANAPYTVRLHFAETFYNAAGARKFNVTINGTSVLTNFDIWATAGAEFKAVIQQFNTNANASGQVIIAFTNVVDNAQINGIELIPTPVPPSNLAAIPGTNAVSLFWTSNPGATSYNVKRSTVSGGPYTTVGSPTAATFTNTGLTTGTTYYYVVSMLNAVGESGNSTQVSAVPPAPPAGNTHGGTWAVQGLIGSTATWAGVVQAPGVTANTDYAFTFWLKGSGAVVLRIFNGSFGSEITRQTFTATSTWQLCTLAVNSGASTQLTFNIADGAGAAGTCYIDDCFVGVANGTNLLTNPGFESGTSPWEVDNPPFLACQPDGPTPPAPTNLVALPGTASASLYWSLSSGATSYTLKRSTVNGSGYANIATGLTVTNYQDNGLTNGTTYYYVVAAANGGGTSANSNQASATPVTPPAGNTHSGTWACQAVMSSTATWAFITQSPSVVSNSSYVASFWLKGSGAVVFRLYNGSYQGEITRVTCTATSTWQRFNIPVNTGGNGQMTFDIADGANTAGTAYIDDCFFGVPGGANVLANGDFEAGNTGWSVGNPPFSIVQPGGGSAPAAPTGLTATPGNAQVALSWSASPGATTYNALRSTVNGGGYASVATGIAPTSYTNTGLTNGTTYYYVVTATNSFGTSPNSAQASATPIASPPAPTGLTATAGNTQVALSWTASGGATTYNLQRSTVSGSGYANVVSQSGTSYTNTGLTNGTTYYFVVSATNAGGTSANSAQASATPSAGTSGLVSINSGGPAISPFVADIDFSGGLTATNWTGAIDTSAVANPAPQAVYQSERYGSPAMTYTIPGLTVGTTYGVRLHFCENFVTAAGQRVFSVAINGTTVLANFDIFATVGAQHKANIQTFNSVANASGQIVIAFTNVTNYALINAIEVTSISIPPTPTGLVATPGNAQVALTWNASTGATSYNVLRSTISNSGFAAVGSSATTSFTNTGLTNGTTYYYVVNAANAAGTSTNSGQASATPQPPVPPVPTGLTATPGNTQVALSWSASSGATAYDVKRSTVSGSGYAAVVSQAGTTYTNTGLTNSTTYYFVVDAKNGGGTSANSAQVPATPQVPAPPEPTGLTATPGNTQVALSWSASSGATAYDVKRSTVSGSGYVTVSSPTTTSYTNTGLTNGTTYYFVVDAKNAGGTSANSSQVSAIPISPNTHTGTWAAKGVFTTTPTWNNFYETPAVTSSQTYVASLWMKGTGAVVLRIMNGNFGTEITRSTFTATSTWTQYQITGIATGANTQMTYCISDGGGVAGTVYFDDCFLGVSAGANTLTNPGFESGNTAWAVDAAFSIVQNP